MLLSSLEHGRHCPREIRSPVSSLNLAAPLALIIVSAGYLLVNICLLLRGEEKDFCTIGVVVAGHFLTNPLRKAFGERVLPWLISFSAFENIAQAREPRVGSEWAFAMIELLVLIVTVEWISSCRFTAAFTRRRHGDHITSSREDLRFLR